MNTLRFSIGILVLASGLLGFFVSRYWLLFTMFIGLNLMQFAFTGFCPLERLLRKINKA